MSNETIHGLRGDVSYSLNGSGGAPSYDPTQDTMGARGSGGGTQDAYLQPVHNEETGLLDSVQGFFRGVISWFVSPNRPAPRRPVSVAEVSAGCGAPAGGIGAPARVVPAHPAPPAKDPCPTYPLPGTPRIEEVLEGRKKIQVTIPPNDDIEKSWVDFQAFCKKMCIKCAFDRYGKTYSFWSTATIPEDKDLIELHENGGELCRPRESYQLEASFKSKKHASISVRLEPNPPKSDDEGKTIFLLDTLNGIPMPCEKGSRPFCNTESWSGQDVALNELLRAIIQNPILLNVIQQEGQIIATGTTGWATLPKDQIAGVPINNGKPYPGIHGKPFWRISNYAESSKNCETGEWGQGVLTPKLEKWHYFTRDGKDNWHNDAGVQVLIRWEPVDRTFRITYGLPLGLVAGY